MLHRLGILEIRSVHENFVYICSPMTSNSERFGGVSAIIIKVRSSCASFEKKNFVKEVVINNISYSKTSYSKTYNINTVIKFHTKKDYNTINSI